MALEYLRQRDQNIMRNDQFFQSLGLSTLDAQVKGKSARNKDDVPEKSRSLYNPEDDEGSNQHDEDEVSMASKVGEDVCNKNVQHIGKFSARGSKASKRVVAPQEGETTRVTRQRTAANPSLAIVTHDALASTNTTTSPNEEHINNNDEGALFASAQQVPWKKYMGKELDALNRGHGTKIKIDITEGNRRPEAPMQAAKLASEAGISLRLHTPIFPHWKEYKKKHNKHLVEAYIGKIPFDMDTISVAVRAACVDMLKGGQRQMRHRLKKYFDGVLANLVRTTSPVTCMTDDQWRALVEMWSNPKHKDTYVKNQVNHVKVHIHQRIGSRCYIAHAYVTAVMEAIEAKPMQEGQKSMSSIEIVSKVLPQFRGPDLQSPSPQ
ncbi:uncharacterized protein [Miscanthus floridulus]|uniref:uncharacterized protein n=1 Tax=Miscanthus floridulus TaxID=154761 RepID=UPI003459E2F6